MTCSRKHWNVESLKRSLVEARNNRLREEVHAAIHREWEGFSVCVKAKGHTVISTIGRLCASKEIFAIHNSLYDISCLALQSEWRIWGEIHKFLRKWLRMTILRFNLGASNHSVIQASRPFVFSSFKISSAIPPASSMRIARSVSIQLSFAQLLRFIHENECAMTLFCTSALFRKENVGHSRPTAVLI